MARRVDDRDQSLIGFQYADDVVQGKIPACKFVIQACERALADVERSLSKKASDRKAFPYYFDVEAANAFCRKAERFRHIKGPLARKRETLTLEPWQCFHLTQVFGWTRRADGLRRFQTAYIEVPRKNGKSVEAATVGLVMLTDDEQGAEVYSAATTRDQAKVVYDVAAMMAKKAPGFRHHYGVDVHKYSITVEGSASYFQPLSSDADSLDGRNPYAALIDELHAHKKRDMWDVLESGMDARDQALIFAITTAGTDLSGICYEQRDYLIKILTGAHVDETFFGIIYTIDEAHKDEHGNEVAGDDWTDPKVWQKANPNWGVSVIPHRFEAAARKAMETPSAVANFLTKRLNVWCQAMSPWLDVREWNACGDASLSIDQFEGEPCWIAVDLASRKDIAAMVFLFARGDDLYVFPEFWLPEKAIDESPNSQYEGWVRQGLIHETEGNTIDFDLIEERIIEARSLYQVRDVAYDPFQATQFATRMTKEGFPMVEFGQTVRNLSEPMKETEAKVLDREIHHDGNAAMNWMISNVVAKLDAKDNIFPRKEIVHLKIDGPIALIMAVGRWIVWLTKTTVYEKRGFRSVSDL